VLTTGGVYYWRGYPSLFDDDGDYKWIAEDVFQQGNFLQWCPVFCILKQLPSQEDREDGESGGSFEILLIQGMTNRLLRTTGRRS